MKANKHFFKRCRLIIAAILMVITFGSTADEEKIDPKLLQPDNLYPQVKFVTNMGVIVVELDRMKAPVTVDNFLKYVVTGSYDNTIFHRIIEGFVVQGGGFDEKMGTLDDKFDPITNEAGNGLKNTSYTIAMARQGHPHSASRQFYFNVGDNKSLDPGPRSWGYAVFGSVSEGEEVIDKMAEIETHMDANLGWPDVPVTPVILRETILLPADA